MRRSLILFAALAALGLGRCAAGEAGANAPGAGTPVPYRVASINSFSAEAKDWNDESMPSYAIAYNTYEWGDAFKRTSGDKPFHPQPAVFETNYLVGISRISAPPAPGQEVLRVKSLAIVDGELVLSYSFMPPAGQSGRRVKNTILVAIPADVYNPLRIVEEIETPDSIATRADREAAKKAGRIKKD